MSATLTPPSALSRLHVPELPAFDPEHALSLEAACRLGLVPGRSGRRLTGEELLEWATEGYTPAEGGPRFVFPTVLDDGRRVATAEWCAAWVTFLAEAHEAFAFDDGAIPSAAAAYNTGDAL
jgi:hypothetical protein